MAPDEGGAKERLMQQWQQQLDDEEEAAEKQQQQPDSPPPASSACAAAAQKAADVAETEELIRFDKSLQELREIRSQLHYAADYCESTYLSSVDKKPIMENTKEYICRAMVTVVDHLGNVSSNLTSGLSQASSFADAELRITSLKQSMLLCEQLGGEFALTKLRWSAVVPRHHPRYLSTDAEKPTLMPRDSVHLTSKAKDRDYRFDKDEGLPLFLYTHNRKPSLVKDPCPGGDSKIVPVSDSISIPSSKGTNHPAFHFQSNNQKLCTGRRHRRTLHGSDILSLIRRVRQTS